MRDCRSTGREPVITLLITAAALAGAFPCGAAQRHVGPGQPYMTIQQAVNAASVNDTVVCHPAAYDGPPNANLDPIDFDLVFLAPAGPESTVINAQNYNGPVFEFSGTDITSATRVEGFSFKDGYDPFDGGGVRIKEGADPVFENCHFISCESPGNGGAVSINGNFGGASPAFYDCVFKINAAEQRGGAVHAIGATNAAFLRCLFYGNSQDHVDHGGGAVYLSDASPTFENCTFVGNSRSQIQVEGPGGRADFRWCAISYSPDGVGLDVESQSSVYLYESIVYGNAGGDAVTCDTLGVWYMDPLYCDLAADDYSLCANSPCIAAHNPNGRNLGCTVEGCGECESPVAGATWGRVKGLFRH
ncbi:MAG: hypothetical protein GF400_10895 [Candidatus Eisenbacteria bacterium]|nr:hypothetical protein [Candidatus Eisenbacteria bacterium]